MELPKGSYVDGNKGEVQYLSCFEDCHLLVFLCSQKDDNDHENLVEFCENELRLTEQCLLSNPKSYGSWHHRYWVLNHHPKANWQREFDLCNKYLSMDDRNCIFEFFIKTLLLK